MLFLFVLGLKQIDLKRDNTSYFLDHTLLEFIPNSKSIFAINDYLSDINEAWGHQYKTAFLSAIENKTNVDVQALQNLADCDYLPAVFLLGEMYFYGIYPLALNHTKAIKLYKRAAKKQFPEAYAQLGFIYRWGVSAKIDLEKQLIYEHLGCELHSTYSCIIKNYKLFFGTNTVASVKRANNFLTSISSHIAALSDRSQLPHTRITALNKELEFPKDQKNSDEELSKLVLYKVRLGDKNAEMELAKAYYYGNLGFDKDIQHAKQLFENHEDDPLALVHLGKIHHLGEGGQPVDIPKAVEYYEKAADMGEPNAFNLLGVIENDRNGKGMQYLEKAAEHGHTSAAFNIAMRQINVPENRTKAYSTLRKLAKQGFVASLNVLSSMFHIGQVRYDEYKAFKYAHKIIQLGPWIKYAETAENFFRTGNYEGAVLTWMKLSDMGNGLAAYNAGLTLLNWERLTNRTCIFKNHLKTAERLLENAGSLDLKVNTTIYRYRAYLKMNKTEKAIKILLENLENAETAFRIAENTLMETKPLNFSFNSFLSYLIFSIKLEKKGIIPTIALMPRIIMQFCKKIKEEEFRIDAFETLGYLLRQHFLLFLAFHIAFDIILLLRRRVEVMFRAFE